MPLARILTLHPDDAASLIQQLERLGFAVEVASPNEQNLDPADLEIEFAVCDQQQVIARAGAIANQLQAEIVVFPGAIPPVPRPLPSSEPLAAGIPKTEDEPQEEPVESVPSPELVPQFQAEDSRASLPELAGVWLDGLSEKVRQSGRRTASGLKRVHTGISSALAGVGNRAAEYREHMKTRAAELRAAREQRRTEAALRRAEAARQAALLEQEERRQAVIAAARLQDEAPLQAENEKRAEIERQHVAEEVAIRQESSAKVQEHIAQFPAKQKQPKPARTSQLRGVFTGVIAASVLFLVGMLLANFTPTSPFPSSGSSGSIEQQVPFGPTTMHGPPGATVGGPAAANAVRAGNTVPRQAAPAQSKPQPARGKAPAKWRRFRSSASRGADSGGGDDVVVKHFGPQPQSQPHAQQAGLKHYSDMQ